MKNPIIMHINYAEQGQTIPEMCDLARRCKYDGIEFRQSIAAYEGKPEAYLDAIAKEAKRCKLKHILFGVMADVMNADAGKRNKEVETADKFCRLAAKRFELTVLNAFVGVLKDPTVEYAQYERHGSGAGKPEHYQWATEAYKALGACAAELDFKFAFETHPAYIHDLPAPTRKLVDMIGSPNVGINLDYANMNVFPVVVPMEEAVSTCGDKIFYAHIKNILKVDGVRGHIRYGLAGGAVNNRQLLKLLFKQKFTGPLGIEAPRPGDREWFAKEDITYLKSVLSDLKAK